MNFRPTKRAAVRTFVLVVVVVCLSRENVWDIAYRLLIVSMHGIWECMDSPLPSFTFKTKPLLKIAKEGLFELVKK